MQGGNVILNQRLSQRAVLLHGQFNHVRPRVAAGTTVFICLKIIAKYSAMLEPVTQQLQAVDMDMMGVRYHIDLLMKAFRAHRDGADRVFSEDIIPEVKTLAKLGIDLAMPRRCARQVHRPNVGGSIEEYYRRTIYARYMDSLIQSLHAKCPPRQSEQPEDRANEQGYWQFRKRSRRLQFLFQV